MAERRDGRGIVMAVEGRSAVVLTPEGEFRRVPLDRPDRQVGDEMPLTGQRGWGWAPAMGGLAVAAALLLAVILSGLRGTSDRFERGLPPLLVEAYVSVDINPSVELGVSGDAVVVQAEALNQDGQRLLGSVVYERKPLADVLTALVRAAASAGYLSPERSGEVVIAATPAGPGGVAPPVVAAVYEGESRARALLSQEGARAAVYAVRSARAELRAEARQHGLSVGKYLMLEALRAQGVSVDPDELRQAGVGRVLREHGVLPGEVLRKAVREARRQLELELIGEKDVGDWEDGDGDGAQLPGLADGEEGDSRDALHDKEASPRGESGGLFPKPSPDERRPGARETRGGSSGRRDRADDEERERKRDGEDGRRRGPLPEGWPMVVPEGEGQPGGGVLVPEKKPRRDGGSSLSSGDQGYGDAGSGASRDEGDHRDRRDGETEDGKGDKGDKGEKED